MKMASEIPKLVVALIISFVATGNQEIMKTRKSLLALLILGVAICIGLPFLFNSTTSQATLTLITSLLTAYTSLLTLLVAVMLFNRFV